MSNVDLSKLSEGGPELNSPSRVIALQQANNNPKFRSKMLAKLEALGATLHLDDLTKLNGKRGRGRSKSEGEEVTFLTFMPLCAFHCVTKKLDNNTTSNLSH